MRRIALACSLVVLAAAGCAAPPTPEPAPTPSAPTVSPQQQAADLALLEVDYSTTATREAAVGLTLALKEMDPARARPLYSVVRDSARSAAGHASQAIEHAAWLGANGGTDGLDDRARAEFTRYWQLGRARLDLAQQRAGLAAAAADSALRCAKPACLGAQGRVVKANLDALSAATYDAQSLLRIAFAHVRVVPPPTTVAGTTSAGE